MKIVHYVSLIIVSFFMLCIQAPTQAGDSKTLFQDDLNRVDSQQLGPPWVEMNEGFDAFQHTDGKYVAPSFIEVEDNSYALHMESHPSCTGSCISEHAHPYAYASLNQTVTGLPLEISSTLQPHRGERTGQVMGVMSLEDGFRELDTYPYAFYLPQNGIGIMVFRGAFNFQNTRMAIYQFKESTEDIIILAEEMLPFQLESTNVYDWRLIVHEDLTLSATISGSQGNHTITSEAIIIDHLMDHFYVSTVSPGTGVHGYDSVPYTMKLDNFFVTQGAENLCSPLNETVPEFCPPNIATFDIYLPIMMACNAHVFCIVPPPVE